MAPNNFCDPCEVHGDYLMSLDTLYIHRVHINITHKQSVTPAIFEPLGGYGYETDVGTQASTPGGKAQFTHKSDISNCDVVSGRGSWYKLAVLATYRSRKSQTRTSRLAAVAMNPPNKTTNRLDKYLLNS